MELGLLGEPSTTLGKQPQRRERVSNDDGLISDSDLIAPHKQVEVGGLGGTSNREMGPQCQPNQKSTGSH